MADAKSAVSQKSPCRHSTPARSCRNRQRRPKARTRAPEAARRRHKFTPRKPPPPSTTQVGSRAVIDAKRRRGCAPPHDCDDLSSRGAKSAGPRHGLLRLGMLRPYIVDGGESRRRARPRQHHCPFWKQRSEKRVGGRLERELAHEAG